MDTKVKKNKVVVIKFRVSQIEATRIRSRAEFFYKGNVSKYLRAAHENFKKPKS